MAKIERKYLAHYINTSTTGEAAYIRLGKDLKEYSPEMSADVQKKKNILGEMSVLVTGYEKSGTVEPYYAEKDDPLFTRLQAIIDGSLALDDCNTDVVEVKLWETTAANGFPATREKAVIEVSSYGGDNTGYQIPFNVHYTGEKEQGYFDPTTKTFKPGSGV